MLRPQPLELSATEESCVGSGSCGRAEPLSASSQVAAATRSAAMASSSSVGAPAPSGTARAATPSARGNEVRIATYNIGANRDAMFSGPRNTNFHLKLKDDVTHLIGVTWVGSRLLQSTATLLLLRTEITALPPQISATATMRRWLGSVLAGW